MEGSLSLPLYIYIYIYMLELHDTAAVSGTWHHSVVSVLGNPILVITVIVDSTYPHSCYEWDQEKVITVDVMTRVVATSRGFDVHRVSTAASLWNH